MANFIKRIRKTSLSSSANKHEKLLEDDVEGIEDPVVEGVKFNVKYLGNEAVNTDCGEEETTAAIKTILDRAKDRNKKLVRVTVNISERGVLVTGADKEPNLAFHIHSISYCMADPTYDHVFAFISEVASNKLECHAFLCPKRKVAKAATLTIAQGFSLAYQSWQLATREKRAEFRQESRLRGARDGVEGDIPGTILIEAQIESHPQPPRASNLIDFTREELPPRTDLIGGFSDAEIPIERGTKWENFDEIQSESLNRNFERLSMTAAPMQILNQLPAMKGEDGMNLAFGAFACSPGPEFGASPQDTPRFGSSLTSSMLMSPVGSPFNITE